MNHYDWPIKNRLCLLHSSLAGAQTAVAALFLQASAKTDQIYAGERTN